MGECPKTMAILCMDKTKREKERLLAHQSELKTADTSVPTGSRNICMAKATLVVGVDKHEMGTTEEKKNIYTRGDVCMYMNTAANLWYNMVCARVAMTINVKNVP